MYTIFFASGISGLIYQVVWLRMLSRTTGVTIHATAIVVAAFMAGLALGSFFFGRFIDKRDDPLRVYAWLELLVAATALLIPTMFSAAIPVYSFVYQATGESVTITALVIGAVSFVTLMLPTALMGGTLPVLTAHLVRKDYRFGLNLSILYGINTLGAVIGVLLSGFIIIGLFGETVAIYTGVVINLLVALQAYLLHARDSSGSDEKLPDQRLETKQIISPYPANIRGFVLLGFAFSGFTSLAYEVIWTRQLILFLENSIYAFAGMLAVFLAGISLGSMSISRIVDRLEKPLLYFGVLELAIAFISVTNLYLFSPLDAMFVAGQRGWMLPIVATVIVVFPITFAFGLILPIAGRCYAETTQKTGSWVGRLYGFNTAGCIAGSLLAGFLMIPLIGCTHTVILLAALNACLGLVMLWLEPAGSRIAKRSGVLLCLALCVLMVKALGEDPFLATIKNRISEGRISRYQKNSSWGQNAKIFFHKEGIEGTVTAFAWGGLKQLWLNGIGMTHLCTETKLMAHLPLMLASDPRELLVVCFGMGTTVKSAAIYPNLSVTAVELVSETFETFKFFHPDAMDLLTRESIRLLANDGRNHLLLSPKKYDVITVDPAPPIWSARTVNLYTSEFFQLCKSRLNDGGVMCLWFPGSTRDNEMSLVRTFIEVFPRCTVWKGPNLWGFYLIGTLRSMPFDEMVTRIDDAFKNRMMVEDLEEYNKKCVNAEQLKRLLVLSENETGILREVSKTPMITDDFPLTEFFLFRN